jgi:glycosyltransferase involved in cell wall biosynthesis
MVHLEAREIEKRPVIGRMRLFLVEQMVNRVLQRARLVISISAYDQRTLGERIRGPVRTIPNAVRNGFFNSDDAAEVGNHVLFAGLLIPRKNVHGIVRAFAAVQDAMPEASLSLAGPAPDGQYFERIMAEVGRRRPGSVEYLGNLTSEELCSTLKRSAVVVLFSEQETLPCIIAEAMASSRPVVSSSVGGVPEMVMEGDTGFLVEPGDEAALAARILQLLKSPDLRRAMGERGHAMARAKWSPARVAADTVDAYRAAQAAG